MIWKIEEGKAIATQEMFDKVHPDFKGETDGVSYVVNYEPILDATVRYPVKFVKEIVQ
jgi:hypothetical protein